MSDRIKRLLSQVLLLAVGLFVCLCGWPGFAAEDTSPPGPPEKSIGTEGIYFLRTSGMHLQARPFEEQSPLLIRIADVALDDDTAIYEIRYMGFYAGEYDLRDYLMQPDGSDLAALPPAVVSIVSVLPAQHNGALGTIAPPPLPGAWPYRYLLSLAALIWVLPMVWSITRRLTRRRIKPLPATLPEKSLADRLEPLVIAVLEGRSDPRQQAMLERLLLGYWRGRLHLHQCRAEEALMRLRAHGEAGTLLRQLEAWLHLPPGREAVDVAKLLAPYRNVSAASAQSPMRVAEVMP